MSREMEHACLNCTYMQQLQYEQCEYCPPIPLAPHSSSLHNTPQPCATPSLPCTMPFYLVPHPLYLVPRPSILCHTPLPCATLFYLAPHPSSLCHTLFFVPHPSTLCHTPSTLHHALISCATPLYLVPHSSTLCHTPSTLHHTPLPYATPLYLVPHHSTFVLVVGCWTDDGQRPLDWWLGARNPGDAVLGEEEGQLPVGGGMAWRSRKDGKQRRGWGQVYRYMHTLKWYIM